MNKLKFIIIIGLSTLTILLVCSLGLFNSKDERIKKLVDEHVIPTGEWRVVSEFKDTYSRLLFLKAENIKRGVFEELISTQQYEPSVINGFISRREMHNEPDEFRSIKGEFYYHAEQDADNLDADDLIEVKWSNDTLYVLYLYFPPNPGPLQ